MAKLPRSFGIFILSSCALAVRATVTDYLIVGGGTAGLVLANRLTEDPSVSVLVLEAGGNGLGNPNISSLALVGAAFNTDIDWQFPIEPLAHAGGRSLGVVPRGKVLGGSSAINGAFYIRGDARDYDQWEVLGNPGWNADSLLAAGFKNEHFFPPSPSQDIEFNISAHGLNGLLDTSYQNAAPSIHDVIINSVGAAGGHISQDIGGGNTNGISHVTHARLPSNATRATSATGYYFPFSFRKNLQVELFTLASKIVWKSTGSTAVASGVEYIDQNGNTKVANATTVILAAGAWGSPPILERSGVGNSSLLTSLGIKTVIDLPGVGENMQEQPGIALQYSLNSSLPLNPLQPLLINMESLQTAIDPSDLVSLESLFVKPDNMNEALFQWYQNLFKGGVPFLEEVAEVSTSGSSDTVLTWIVGPIHPLSSGSCHIVSTNASVKPAIDYNWFASEFDTRLLALSAQRIEEIVSTPPLSNFITGRLLPAADVNTTAAFEAYALATARGANHPVGSALMAPRNIGGVVDSNLKVYGTSNVYVIDASVIPVEPVGHTQATVYAVAERAAELLTY